MNADGATNANTTAERRFSTEKMIVKVELLRFILYCRPQRVALSSSREIVITNESVLLLSTDDNKFHIRKTSLALSFFLLCII